MTQAATIARLPQDLNEIMQLGRAAHRRSLAFLHRHLAIALDAIARGENSTDKIKTQARALSTAFARHLVPAELAHADVDLIESAMQQMVEPPLLHVQLPVNDFRLLTRDEMRARLNQWLDDVPDEPVLIEVADGSEGQTAKG